MNATRGRFSIMSRPSTPSVDGGVGVGNTSGRGSINAAESLGKRARGAVADLRVFRGMSISEHLEKKYTRSELKVKKCLKFLLVVILIY